MEFLTSIGLQALAASQIDHHETAIELQTLAISIVAGVSLVIFSHKIKVSAIVLLLVGGVLLGPEVLGFVQPNTLGENTLRSIISLAVALILFEGGLSLNLAGYKQASQVIRRLLSVGVLITWFATSAIIWLLFRNEFGESAIRMSLLASSLVIVTGPTVIAPLLRRIKIKQNLHDILHWEGVLIDPIGVFIAILTYEWITGTGGVQEALWLFAERLAAGLIVGILCGLAADWLIRKKLVPEDQTNIFIIAVGLMVFAIDDWLIPESGLLGVVVAGLVLGWRRPGPLRQIKEFKAEITDLLIGTLFILLAAQLDFDDFRTFGLKGVLAVLAVMFVVRPLNIFACTAGSTLTFRDRLFLSYVAPRGIVAASMASLFAITLQDPNSSFLVTFTFSVIAFTVLLQGATSGQFAKILKLQLPPPKGWLIIGAHPLARRVAKFLIERGKLTCVLVDSNRKAIAEAQSEGLNAVSADARDPGIEDRYELRGVGNVLALTDNEELNVIICQRWYPIVGREKVYRWGSGRATGDETHEQPGIVVWKNLPKPSLLAGEIARGEASLLRTTHNSGGVPENTPVVLVQSGTATLDPTAGGREEKLQQPGELLVLKREADYLAKSLRPELVVRLEGVTTRDKLFEELIARVTQVEPMVPREEMISELQEREKAFPTALGHNVAVPHAYCGTLNRRICAIASLPAGIDFDAPDNEPVHLAFLLISPKGDPEGHLATIAEIARIVADVKLRERLLKAPEPGDIYALISTWKPA